MPPKKDSEQNNTEKLLENMILHNHDGRKHQASLTENHIQATVEGDKKTHNLLENLAQGHSLSLKEHEKTNENLEKIAKNMEVKEDEDGQVVHIKTKKPTLL